MTIQSFNLNLIPQGIQPILHVSQYDTGQIWQISLFVDDEAFTVPAGASVYVQGTKQNGSTFKEQCTYSGSVVTATETQDMTNIAGKVRAEISIEKGEEVISTLNFIIDVEKAA